MDLSTENLSIFQSFKYGQVIRPVLSELFQHSLYLYNMAPYVFLKT